jgi:hypothetical protein
VKDPLSAFLLALGFASILSPAKDTIVGSAMLCAGLVGLHRVLGKRAPLYLVAGVIALWVLQHFWGLLPVEVYKLEAEHKTLFDAPGFVAKIVWVALLAAIPIVARPRIGNGLMVLGLASLGLAVLAKGPLRVTEDASSASIVFGAIETGWLGVAVRVVAITFLAAAFDAKMARLDKRGLVVVAVIGAALFAATYDGMPVRAGGNNEGANLLSGASMALALVLSAIGFAGVARAGGGVGSWIAMALSIAQLPLLVYGLALSDKMQSLRAPIAAVLFFELLAIGVAGVTAPAMGARTARGAAGIVALSALFGTLLAFSLLLGGSIGFLHTRDPFGPLERFAFPIAGHAAVAWAASLAYLVAPPSARVAA